MFRAMLILLVFGACVSAPLLASAQNGLSSIVDSVNRLDKNFDAADRSHDGLLSKDEAEAGHVAFIAKNFDAIDTSKRGLVSKDDVHAYIRRLLMHGQPAPASAASSSGK
ncbi:hypothetical protein [Rhodanobacter sp. C03]|uniref:hypothetical protein n=1 Tax=Rhodanobacter sp. C03 TaxID=1945858 RepID=UPI000987092B|nr:hypothetical protein [Rhodanobacter sp. C03]OOG54419.1 hypothetical protein B0E48_14015 [Rhodanobacter sp. C03]